MLIAFFVVSTGACLMSLFRLKNTNNVYIAASYLGKLSKILGLEIELRIPDEIKKLGPVVYIGNHQNSYDIFTISSAIQPNTVSLGKKSLKWIPFFGQMYWLTGNILIDRKNTTRARDTISITADNIKKKGLSVWLFPEGTRSNGQGLLPFKTGAFRTAAMAGVPIVPICLSNLHNKIQWNRLDNGKLIIEFLPPIYIEDNSRETIKAVTQQAHDVMLKKIQEISLECGEPYPEYQAKK